MTSPIVFSQRYFHYSIISCWIYKYPTDRSWIFLISNRQSVGYSNIQQGIKQRKLKKCWNVYFQQNFVIHKCISDKPRINFSFLLASLKYHSNGIHVFPGTVDLYIHCTSVYFALKNSSSKSMSAQYSGMVFYNMRTCSLVHD